MGFFDRIGENISNAPPEAWFTLAQALAANPNVGQGLAQGLAGFGGAIQDSKKKRSLATALGGMASSLPDNQRPIFEALTQYAPETLLQGYASQMFGDKGHEAPTSIQEYEYAKQQGFRGTLTDFITAKGLAGAGVVNIPGLGTFDKTGAIVGGTMPQPSPQSPQVQRQDTAPRQVDVPNMGQLNAPTTDAEMLGAPQEAPQAPLQQYNPVLGPMQSMLGLSSAPQGQQYVFGENNKPELTPIKGYKPQQTALPAEVSSRVGLAEGFLKRYAEISNSLSDLETAKGRAQLILNTGRGGEVKRYIESGAEALIRALTGAGKSQEEASSYASRYLPHPLDTPYDLQSKLNGLRYDLENSISAVMRDRGGWKSPVDDNAIYPALPDSPMKLIKGKIYKTPDGPMKFIGNGKFESVGQ